MCRENNGCQFVLIFPFLQEGRQQSLPFHLNHGPVQIHVIFNANVQKCSWTESRFLRFILVQVAMSCCWVSLQRISIFARLTSSPGKHPNCWELSWMRSCWNGISLDVLNLFALLSPGKGTGGVGRNITHVGFFCFHRSLEFEKWGWKWNIS